ncbi:hypothetical protein QJS10_CPA08g00965 [Acorus calamus]|uniref:2-C-methyl-D-erythritol 4-phosphate cytidylyltransferase n=1 Tax=Acorus calamus TaxID=4465 RepID=A0AAV9E9Z9_ACOCL|nr:hypothetical protein QJS10_CPA08g00965 [Acorus calamus]
MAFPFDISICSSSPPLTTLQRVPLNPHRPLSIYFNQGPSNPSPPLQRRISGEEVRIRRSPKLACGRSFIRCSAKNSGDEEVVKVLGGEREERLGGFVGGREGDTYGDASKEIHVDLKFALPGKERQDSVFNGYQEIDGSSELVCIHDSARPLVTSRDVEKALLHDNPNHCCGHNNQLKVLKDGSLNGAAVLGVPVKATIKEANSNCFVIRTLDRKTLWEMQTPQVIKPKLLRNGFELVNREGLEVTDDVSIVEHLKHPVYITEGSYTNIKVTTPDDLLLAERILNTGVPVPA